MINAKHVNTMLTSKLRDTRIEPGPGEYVTEKYKAVGTESNKFSLAGKFEKPPPLVPDPQKYRPDQSFKFLEQKEVIRMRPQSAPSA